MAPTLIFAGIILALMTGGILFVLNYLQNRDTPTANSNANVNTAAANVANCKLGEYFGSRWQCSDNGNF